MLELDHKGKINDYMESYFYDFHENMDETKKESIKEYFNKLIEISPFYLFHKRFLPFILKEGYDKTDKEKSDEELSDEELREKELRDKELRDKELRDEELSDEELRDKELRDKELIKKQIKEIEVDMLRTYKAILEEDNTPLNIEKILELYIFTNGNKFLKDNIKNIDIKEIVSEIQETKSLINENYLKLGKPFSDIEKENNIFKGTYEKLMITKFLEYENQEGSNLPRFLNSFKEKINHENAFLFKENTPQKIKERSLEYIKNAFSKHIVLCDTEKTYNIKEGIKILKDIKEFKGAKSEKITWLEENVEELSSLVIPAKELRDKIKSIEKIIKPSKKWTDKDIKELYSYSKDYIKNKDMAHKIVSEVNAKDFSALDTLEDMKEKLYKCSKVLPFSYGYVGLNVELMDESMPNLDFMELGGLLLTEEALKINQVENAWINIWEFAKISLISNAEIIMQDSEISNFEKSEKINTEIQKLKNTLDMIKSHAEIYSKDKTAKADSEIKSSFCDVNNLMNAQKRNELKDSLVVNRSILYNTITDFFSYHIPNVPCIEEVLSKEILFDKYKNNDEYSCNEPIEKYLFWELTQPTSGKTKQKKCDENWSSLSNINSFFQMCLGTSLELSVPKMQKFQNITQDWAKENIETLLHEETSISQNLFSVKRNQVRSLLENRRKNSENFKPVAIESKNYKQSLITKLKCMCAPNSGYSENVQKAANDLLNVYSTQTGEKINKLEEKIAKFVTIPKNIIKIKGDIEEIKEEIIKEFPYFENEGNYIFNKIQNEQNEVQGISFKACCLDGAPGIGKTRFCQKIGEALGIPVFKISLSTVNDPKELLGFSYTYEGSQPGRLFEALTATGALNSIVLLDEIDKIKPENAHILLDLLEPNQSKKITNNYFNVELDYSHITFIATSNDIETLEKNAEALVNRLQIMTSKSPTFDEKKNIFNKSLEDVLKKNNISKSDYQISEEALDLIVNKGIKKDSEGVREIINSVSHCATYIIGKKKDMQQKVEINEQNVHQIIEKSYEEFSNVINNNGDKKIKTNMVDSCKIKWKEEHNNQKILGNKNKITKGKAYQLDENYQKNINTFIKKYKGDNNKNDNEYLDYIEKEYKGQYFKDYEIKWKEFQKELINNDKLKIELVFKDSEPINIEYQNAAIEPGQITIYIPNPNKHFDRMILKNHNPEIQKLIKELICKINVKLGFGNVNNASLSHNPSADEHRDVLLHNLANDIIGSNQELIKISKSTQGTSKSESSSKTKEHTSGGISVVESNNIPSTVGIMGNVASSLYGKSNIVQDQKTHSTTRTNPSIRTTENISDNNTFSNNTISLPSEEMIKDCILNFFDVLKGDEIKKYRKMLSNYKSIPVEPDNVPIDVSIDVDNYLNSISQLWTYYKSALLNNNFPFPLLLDKINDECLARLDKLCQWMNKNKEKNLIIKYDIKFLATDIIESLDMAAKHYPSLIEANAKILESVSKNMPSIRKEQIKKGTLLDSAIKFINVRDICSKLMNTTSVKSISKENFEKEFSSLTIFKTQDFSLEKKEEKSFDNSLKELSKQIKCIQNDISWIEVQDIKTDLVSHYIKQLESKVQQCNELVEKINKDFPKIRVLLPINLSKLTTFFTIYDTEKELKIEDIKNNSFWNCIPILKFNAKSNILSLEENDNLKNIKSERNQNYENILDYCYKDNVDLVEDKNKLEQIFFPEINNNQNDRKILNSSWGECKDKLLGINKGVFTHDTYAGKQFPKAVSMRGSSGSKQPSRTSYRNGNDYGVEKLVKEANESSHDQQNGDKERTFLYSNGTNRKCI